MKQVRPFVDERLSCFCYSCNGVPATRDHVPAKVFLDEPFPDNLPIVGACRDCNEGASVDEEYVACLLEVAACGFSSEPERPKIRRIFRERPAIAARLGRAVTPEGYIAVERERVRRVITKLARGLWSYESGEPTGLMNAEARFNPIAILADDDLDAFLTMSPPTIFPEVGSRLMIKVIEGLGEGQGFDPWQIVQPSRFSYAVDIGGGASARVKMIIRDVLAAEVDLVASG
jgi:hypothetical protein